MELFDFDYRKLGIFTYHVLRDPAAIKRLLLHWIMREWAIDHQENPDEPWTVDWLESLPRMEFGLHALHLSAITPRTDLMNHRTDTDSFMESLERRADEREEAMLRGVSIEPLLVKRQGMELMD